MSWVLPVHRALSTLVALAVVLQFFLAGAGAFGATSFDLHEQVGVALVAAAIVLLVLAALGRRQVRLAVALLALTALQWAFAAIGSDQEAWIGALHGLNALAVIGVAGTNARGAWGAARGPDPGAATAAGHGGARERSASPSMER